MPVVSRAAPVPLYHQVKTAILHDLDAGRWRPGERLPTEDALIARFHVSKITVRRALRELAQMGCIRREQGRGTFVERPPLEEGPRELTSFTGEMLRHGLLATSRVIEQGVVLSSADVALRLGIDNGAPVFRLRRLRLADSEPMGLQTAYVPMHLVPGIDLLSFTDASLYEVFATRYALYAAAARESHQAIAMPEEAAGLLRVPAGSPCLSAERLATLADGRPLEYVDSIMRGDRYKIVLDLTRPAR